MIDYSLVFIAGLFASLHCIGMCGPIVLAYALPGATDQNAQKPSGTFVLHAAYNSGRIMAYATLGALGGATGLGLRTVGGLHAGTRALQHGDRWLCKCSANTQQKCEDQNSWHL